MCSDYKTTITHRQNIKDLGGDNFNVLQKLYHVHYLQEYNNPLSRFGLSTSFSILDWIIVDEAKTGNLEQRVV